MAIRNRVFSDYLAMYREAIRSTRYADLAELQPAPLAPLGHGGAGTAYALWRLGDPRRAKTWIAAAVADKRADAYSSEIQADHRRRGLLFGRPGVLWAHAMIVPAATDAYARAIAAPFTVGEHASGSAGHYLAARVLLARKPHARLARIVAKLGAGLVEQLRARAATPWTKRDADGFAHGWGGVAYAALAHAPEDTGVIEAIAGLGAAWTPDGVMRHFQASWCNGAAGSLLLWTKAFALTRQAHFLELAHRTATVAIAESAQNRGLCCGGVGVAYALLALERTEPEAKARRRWRAAAREAAASEIATPQYVHSNGLYYGHPGLACLAQDLLADEPRGFPGIEA